MAFTKNCSDKYGHHLTKPYRPGVGIMVIANGKVFVAKRLDIAGQYWQMPQGGIDENENYTQAAKRELYEETGIRNIEIIMTSNDWYYYDVPEYLSNNLWSGKYRGQKQKWFLMQFTGDDSEIDLNATSSPEFVDWRWIKWQDLISHTVPFKRKMYEDVMIEFSNHLT